MSNTEENKELARKYIENIDSGIKQRSFDKSFLDEIYQDEFAEAVTFYLQDKSINELYEAQDVAENVLMKEDKYKGLFLLKQAQIFILMHDSLNEQSVLEELKNYETVCKSYCDYTYNKETLKNYDISPETKGLRLLSEALKAYDNANAQECLENLKLAIEADKRLSKAGKLFANKVNVSPENELETLVNNIKAQINSLLLSGKANEAKELLDKAKQMCPQIDFGIEL